MLLLALHRHPLPLTVAMSVQAPGHLVTNGNQINHLQSEESRLLRQIGIRQIHGMVSGQSERTVDGKKRLEKGEALGKIAVLVGLLTRNSGGKLLKHDVTDTSARLRGRKIESHSKMAAIRHCSSEFTTV